MKRTIAILLAILCMISSVCFAEGTTSPDNWFTSSDGIFEASIQSIDTTQYPKVKVNFKYLLDGEKESLRVITVDLSADISNYIAQNPAYQNRKVPVSTKEVFDVFEWQGGTVYYLFVTFVIGNKNPMEVQKGFNDDMANAYPDDFVNYDAHNAARAIKASAEKLNLSSYSVKNCKAAKSVKFDSVSYYKFTLVEGTWAKTYLAIFSGSNYAVILYNENNLMSLMTEVSVLINNSAVLGNPKYDTKCAGYIAEYIDIEDTSAYHLSSIAKYLD